jgi:hypothetical protein
VAVLGMDVFFVYGFKNYSGNATVIKGRTSKGKRKNPGYKVFLEIL